MYTYVQTVVGSINIPLRYPNPEPLWTRHQQLLMDFQKAAGPAGRCEIQLWNPLLAFFGSKISQMWSSHVLTMTIRILPTNSMFG